MAGLMARATAALARAVTPLRRRQDKDRPPGGFSFGTQWLGGPSYTDAFATRRAPSPWQLIERYKGLAYAMAARNVNGVTRIPLRLYADASRVQGKPARACDPIPVSRAIGRRLARAGLVSPAAVDKVEEVRNHPILGLLDNPDGEHYFDRRQLLGLMVGYMDVVGSGLLVPDGNGWDWTTGRTGNGPPETLWVVYSQYAIPIRQPGDPRVDYFQYFRDRIPYANMLWFRQSISLRDPYGAAYSPLYAADIYQDQESRFIAIYDQILGLGPRPNMVVSAKDPLMPPGEPERKRFEQDLNRRQAAGNAGGAIVTTGAFDFTPVNYPPTDMGGKELAEYDRNCMCSIFGQPPTYYTTDTNLANLQAADEQFARNGVEPRCDCIAGILTGMVRKWDPRLFFKFDPAIQEDDESKEKVVTMRLASGRTTINQENEEDRWPAVAWGDEPWLPGTMKQPSMITEAHEQGMEQIQAGIKQGDAAVKQADKGLEHDGKRIEIEGKKAAQKPAQGARQRALWQRLETLRAELAEAT
jgi:hypothetical protein